jgi:hypothetical protein
VREATLPQDWRADDLKEYSEEPIALIDGSTGILDLRDRYSRRSTCCSASSAWC